MAAFSKMTYFADDHMHVSGQKCFSIITVQFALTQRIHHSEKCE